MSSPGLKVCLSLFLVLCFSLEISAGVNSSSSHDPITFSVYHIGHLIRPLFHDDKSFVETMLARERAALSFATSSHDHMKGGKNRLSTDDTAFPLVARRMGGYVVRVQVGTQRQQVHLMLDTGSSFMWWQCRPCTNCFPLGQIYDRRYSASSSSVPCRRREHCDVSQEFINGCVDGGYCGFGVEYVDGDEARGILAFDSIWSEDGRFSEIVNFGCATNNTGTFHRGVYSGILGFGMGPYSFPRLVNATKFSFCLKNFDRSDESYWVHEPNYMEPLYLNDIPPDYDSDNDKALVVPIRPVDDRKGFYGVELAGVAIGDEMIGVSPDKWSRPSGDGVVIDTGFLMTRFPLDIYSVFRDKFEEVVRSSYTPFRGYGFDLCYRIKSEEDLGDFPTVSFHFANNSEPLELPLEHVVVRAAKGTYCLAFLPSDPSDPYTTILGTYQLQRVRQTYDLSQKTISLFPMSC